MMLLPRRHREIFIAVGLLLLIFVVYGMSIDRTMQCDEANTLYKYSSNPLSALFGYTTPNNHLVHSFLVWVTTSLMGFSHIGVRFTAFMASMLTFAMAYRVGQKILNHQSGLATMGLLGVSLSVVGFALAARGYTLSAFLTLAIIDQIFLSPSVSNRRKNYVVLLLSFLLLMVLPSMALLLFPIIVWKIWEFIQTRLPQYIQQIMSIGIGGICAFIFYVPSIIEGSALEHLSQFGEPDVMTLIIHWIEAVYSPSIFGIPALLAVGIGFVILVIRAENNNLLIGLVLIVCTAVGASIVQELLTDRTLYARNYFYLTVVFALVGGVGLASVLRRYLTPVVYLMMLVMAIYVPQASTAPAIDQLIDAIPQYQPETELLGNQACHILAAYYELTETQGGEVISWGKDSQATSVLIPIPVGFQMSVDRAIADNGFERDDFAECRLVEDDYDWLDNYICTPK